MNMKFELLPIGDFNPAGDTCDLTGLVFALLSWFMLGAGPFAVFLPTRLSKSMLMLPAFVQVDPIAMGFLEGSPEVSLLVELLLLIELEGRRMSFAEKEKTERFVRIIRRNEVDEFIKFSFIFAQVFDVFMTLFSFSSEFKFIVVRREAHGTFP